MSEFDGRVYDSVAHATCFETVRLKLLARDVFAND